MDSILEVWRAPGYAQGSMTVALTFSWVSVPLDVSMIPGGGRNEDCGILHFHLLPTLHLLLPLQNPNHCLQGSHAELAQHA